MSLDLKDAYCHPAASFVPGHSYRADDRSCLSRVSHENSAPHGFLREKDHPTTQCFPEHAGPYGSGFADTSDGSASHVTYPFLAEAEGSIHVLTALW